MLEKSLCALETLPTFLNLTGEMLVVLRIDDQGGHSQGMKFFARGQALRVGRLWVASLSPGTSWGCHCLSYGRQGRCFQGGPLACIPRRIEPQSPAGTGPTETQGLNEMETVTCLLSFSSFHYCFCFSPPHPHTNESQKAIIRDSDGQGGSFHFPFCAFLNED